MSELDAGQLHNEISDVQANLIRLERDIRPTLAEHERAIQDLMNKFVGKIELEIQSRSGVDGFDKRYRAWVEDLGGIESEEGTAIRHPWKVAKGGQRDDADAPEWTVTGGDVYSQGGVITVVDGAVNLKKGWIYLKITRNTSSRAVTAVEIAFTTTTIPESDYSDQYIAIAYVDEDVSDLPLQLLFQELKVWEEMTVVNGEFKLIAKYMAHRNTYDPSV